MIQTSAWLKELFHEISKKVHAYTPDCYLGFSRLLHGAETIQQSYMEALRAVDLGKTIHKDQNYKMDKTHQKQQKSSISTAIR